ncbi:MAG TPA: DUF2304 domain-containing protein [Candidatus Blautia gallistercoris]|uniref:DUF2304 domain-containing protein n=1 Tax=Candidatus Blautia gallistercoris TaxID=2838490 RepID=A0A9D1WJX2_9FIRM|nr:DUF2304 domain-containing protein [Candidatus Blautia gallistercoris]
MTLVLRVLLIAFSLLTFLYMVRKIRQSKLQIEYAIFWIVFSFILIFMSLFPGVVSFFTWLAGIQAPVNLVFMAIIFILILKLFSMTVKLSELENKTKELAQEIAIQQALEQEKTLEKNSNEKKDI